MIHTSDVSEEFHPESAYRSIGSLNDGDVNNTYATIGSAWFTQWDTTTRYKIMIVVICTTYCVSLATPVLYPCFAPIQSDFDEENIWAVAFSSYSYLLVQGIMYAVWSSISDRVGRRPVLIGCIVMYFVSTYMIAVSWNVLGLTVTRLLAGLFGSAVLPICKRIITEVVPPSIRGFSLAVLLLNPFVTIFFGPLLGGLMSQYFYWQYAFLILSVASTLCFLAVLFMVPETLDSRKREFTNPLKPLIYIMSNFELSAVTLLVSLETACMYFIYLMISLDFPTRFGLDPILITCCYLIIGVGYVIGGVPGGLLTNFLRNRFDFGGRLLIPVLLFVILAACNALLGWSLELKRIGVTMGMIFLCSIVRNLMFPGAFSYCVEFKPKHAMIIIDGLLISQMLFSFLSQMIGTVIGQQIQYNYQYVFTLISLSMLISGIPVTVVLVKRLLRSSSS